MENQVLVSVVTVCYNAASTLEQTILSVLNQTYPYIEYIIIDGGSTDGTVDIIKKYADRIAYWVSEPDKGIYDAMNKGIRVATGEWINFMNSGDILYQKETIETVFSQVHNNNKADILYGLLVNRFKYGDYVWKQLALSSFSKRMPIGHPSTFVRTELMKKYRFDCRFRVAADYNFFYFLYSKGYNFLFVDTLVAVFESETGVSSTLTLTAMKESAQINGSYGTLAYYLDVVKTKLYLAAKHIMAMISPTTLMKLQKRKRDKDSQYMLLEEYILENRD